MYRRNRKHVADMIFNDTKEVTGFLSVNAINDTYGKLYSFLSPQDDAEMSAPKPSGKTYYPISTDVLAGCLKSIKHKYPGVDNISLLHLKNLDQRYLLTILSRLHGKETRPF